MTAQPAPKPLRVMFACVGNSARSQMAHGFAKALGGERVVAASGGSRPLGRVLPEAIEAMREKGIDISAHESRPIDEAFVREADLVVTMGCGDDLRSSSSSAAGAASGGDDACPAFIGKRMEDWALPDPHGGDLATFRKVRDEIERRVRDLLARHDALP